MLLALPAMAQDDDAESTVEVLDLFDEDEERTKKGWIQFYASLGIMSLGANGSLSAHLPNGNKTTIIDFDRAGLKEADNSYWLSLNWRSANSHWGAWFGSWRYDVSGSHIWGTSLEIPGREPIPVGASVTSDFDAHWFILEGTYSFYRSETVDAGIGFGFHVVDLDTTITASVQVGDQEATVISQQIDTLAPLPNGLVYLHWKFAPRWSLVSRVGYFGLDYKDYSGKMTNAHAMVNYEISPRWALGLGYQFVDLDLEVEETNHVQVYDIEFSGPMAYVRFHF